MGRTDVDYRGLVGSRPAMDELACLRFAAYRPKRQRENWPGVPRDGVTNIQTDWFS
jgi:hypothetical protein